VIRSIRHEPREDSPDVRDDAAVEDLHEQWRELLRLVPVGLKLSQVALRERDT
jgi:hypothetical protein